MFYFPYYPVTFFPLEVDLLNHFFLCSNFEFFPSILQLNAKSFPVNQSFMGFDLVQDALKPEDLDNVMKDLKLCSGCMNYKPKLIIAKTGDCVHKKCENVK